MSALSIVYLIIISPVWLFAEISFFTLPLTVIGACVLFLVSLIKKDFVKFNRWIEILLIMISFGITNLFVEEYIGDTSYFWWKDFMNLYIYVGFFILSCVLIMYLANKKDVRFYLIWVLIFLVTSLYNISGYSVFVR